MVTLPLYMGYIGGAQIEYTLSVSFFSVGRLLGGIAFGAMSHKYATRLIIHLFFLSPLSRFQRIHTCAFFSNSFLLSGIR